MRWFITLRPVCVLLRASYFLLLLCNIRYAITIGYLVCLCRHWNSTTTRLMVVEKGKLSNKLMYPILSLHFLGCMMFCLLKLTKSKIPFCFYLEYYLTQSPKNSSTKHCAREAWEKIMLTERTIFAQISLRFVYKQRGSIKMGKRILSLFRSYIFDPFLFVYDLHACL